MMYTLLGHAAAAGLGDDRKSKVRDMNSNRLGNDLPPAVVIGARSGGLAVARALGEGNVPVIMVDPDPHAAAMHSRFVHKAVVLPLYGRALIDGLIALNPNPGKPYVLILTNDETIPTISDHRAELEGRYLFAMPPPDCVNALSSKSTFQVLAEKHGFAVPRTVRIQKIEDVEGMAKLNFPCVIKPAVKPPAYHTGKFDRGYKVQSIEEARTACATVLPIQPDLVAQEWIDGGDDELYFCLFYRASEGIVTSFTGRKITIWPPTTGSTASCTAAPDEIRAKLEPITEAFFRAVSFVGLGSMEYKWDARNERFVMIEPTVCRVDAQEDVATINGVNIPLTAYFHELGKEVPRAAQSAAPVVWLDHARHWMARFNSRAARGVQSGFKIRDVYWRFEDPLPGVFFFLQGIIKYSRRAFGFKQ